MCVYIYKCIQKKNFLYLSAETTYFCRRDEKNIVSSTGKKIQHPYKRVLIPLALSQPLEYAYAEVIFSPLFKKYTIILCCFVSLMALKVKKRTTSVLGCNKLRYNTFIHKNILSGEF